ncbi:hypothetical protein L3X38_014200 [Prunus dulcis]|uniref:Uncharacterized protein n=1 Tax=Prunus dulcis TaxID=3755 RepID=A0AAD4WQ63_PRUDU|nr:hypothetical protein L3X38_014200 [Prunus dulcis]
MFAEATKEVVDFLFMLLSLPVGTVVRLFSKNGMVGCLGQLYESVENLSDTYLQPNLDKDTLLKHKSPVAGANILHFLANNANKMPNSFTFVLVAIAIFPMFLEPLVHSAHLLKASLESNTVLTDAFLRKRRA